MFRRLWQAFFGSKRDRLRELVEERRLHLQIKTLEAQGNLFDQLVDPREPFLDDPDFYPVGPGGEWVPTNVDRRNRGETLPVYTSEFGLKFIRDRQRRLVVDNEFALNALTNRVSYICGKGMQTKAVLAGTRSHVTPGTDDLTAAVQEVLDEFMDRTLWSEREQEAVWRADRDGECFVRFFHIGEGLCDVRWVEPEHVRNQQGSGPELTFGVETAPGDVEDVVAYHVVDNPTLAWTTTRVEAAEILHVKLNTDGTMKRGLPTLYPVRTNLERAETLLRNMSVLAAVQSTYAVIRKHKGMAASAISAFAAAQAESSPTDPVTGNTQYLRSARPGSIIDTSDASEWEFPASRVDASSLVAILQAELRAVASRLVMPEFMLTSDASNGNFAGQFIAETPSTKNFERLQAFWARRFGDGKSGKPSVEGALWRVIRIAVEYGRLPEDALSKVELQVEGPSLVVRDKAGETNRCSTLNKEGVLSKATWSKFESLDREQEKKQLAEEATEAGPQPQPPQQGQGGDPFGTAPATPASVPPGSAEGTSFREWLTEAVLLEAGFSGQRTDAHGHKRCYRDGKPVPCGDPSGGGTGDDATGTDDAHPSSGLAAPVASRLSRLISLVASVPAKARDAALSFVKKKYLQFEGRYGSTGAKLVLAGTILLTPIPLPGTSLAPVALAEGIRAAYKLFAGNSKPAVQEASDADLAKGVVECLKEYSVETGAPALSATPEQALQAIRTAKQQDTGHTGDKARTAFLAAQEAGLKGLPEDKASAYKTAIATVAGKLSDQALARIGKHLKGTVYYVDRKAMTAAMAKDHPVQFASILSKGATVGGGYDKTTGKLHLDGRYFDGEATWLPPETGYAHEVTHAIDGPSLEISKSAEWSAAWEAEIKPGGLSKYAATKTSEGLAEFGRLVMTGGKDRAAIEARYPKCAAVWSKYGLWSE